ncbi:MAG: LacI family transcriptional regulator [Synergistaceae bacterium]|jgi:LacI family transcriptional regulator|nr:LacI family transcriptional regulator [Synergistaceae bacterium]
MKMRNKRITIKDVALSAGVSTGTVSRFIRNHGYVGEGARSKIAAAIRELQYVPSAAARSMINKDSQIIGIAVPEINNPFLADLVVKIEAGLSRKNYSIMICNTGYNIVKVEHFMDDLIMRDADGVVMIATQGTPKILEKMKAFMHGVIVGQKTSNFDSINFDDRKAAYDIASHLIGLGHREIACIGFHVNAPQTIDRRDGVLAALGDHGIQARQEYMIGEDGSSHPKMESVAARNVGYVYSKWLLELSERPTAIIAINDFYAIGAYEAIIEKGLKVGQDVSVTGFDDISIAKFLTPTLTTVNCDTKIMADLAVEILMRKITGESGDASVERNFTLPSEIVLRESSKAHS